MEPTCLETVSTVLVLSSSRNFQRNYSPDLPSPRIPPTEGPYKGRYTVTVLIPSFNRRRFNAVTVFVVSTYNFLSVGEKLNFQYNMHRGGQPFGPDRINLVFPI